MPGKAQAAQGAAPQAFGGQLGGRVRLGRPAADGLPHHQRGGHRDGKDPARAQLRKHQARHRGPHSARGVVGNAHGGDGLGPFVTRHGVDDRRVPSGCEHCRAAAADKHQKQHRRRATPAPQRQQREQGARPGLRQQCARYQPAPVGGVRQHAGRECQQKHGHEHRRLHQSSQERRTREFHHEPGRRHALHAAAHKKDATTDPQAPERGLAQGAPQRGRVLGHGGWALGVRGPLWDVGGAGAPWAGSSGRV